MSGITKGGVTVKVLQGRSASGLLRYEGELGPIAEVLTGEGKEPPLFSLSRNCSAIDAETRIAEWKATRQEHGTDGAARAKRSKYETVDPATGLHASGQIGTHVKYYDGSQWRKRPVRQGETPTHLYVPAERLMVKESEALHTIYAASADLVNPDDIDACERFFLAVAAERKQHYAGLQERLWLERNGESGLVHVHVASNTTIYEGFTADSVDYSAGQKIAKGLTDINAIRSRFEQFLDANPVYGLEQSLARVGTAEYDRAQSRTAQVDYWEKARGQESKHDKVRRTVYEALNDASVTDHPTFVARMKTLGVHVREVGLRRGVPGKSHDYTYVLAGAKQGVRGKTLGAEYTLATVGAQLELKAAGKEIEPPAEKQHAGADQLLPFEAKPWSQDDQQAFDDLKAEVATQARVEREAQGALLMAHGPHAAAHTVLRQMAERRSAWSTRDLQVAMDRYLAPVGEVSEEDMASLSEQAMATLQADLISLLDREVDSDTIRHWTTQDVLDTEQRIHSSLMARAQHAGQDGVVKSDRGTFTLTPGQALAAQAMTGSHKLVVIEGAAGAGKTTVLDAAHEQIKANGGRLVVVSPTKRGAMEAGEAIKAEGNSVHSMLYRAGAKFDEGRWVLPHEWQDQPEQFTMDESTVLVVDEAGMLDKATAAAMHRYVDDMKVGTLVLTGDTKQLSAVGRGGYLTNAGEVSAKHLDLTDVQRFRTIDGHVDKEYADASLKLRERLDANSFYDMLDRRNQVSFGDHAAVIDRVAETVALELQAEQKSIAIAATNATAQEINRGVYERLVSAGVIDDTTVVKGRDGDPIAVGATVATRKNDRDMDVANRQTWTVVDVRADGSVAVKNTKTDRHHELTGEYVRENVQLAYSFTAHGSQGMTVDTAHVVLGERMNAAGAYVGLTRGKRANVLHAVASDARSARAQFRSVMRRENTDLGLDAARTRAMELAADRERALKEEPDEFLRELRRDAKPDPMMERFEQAMAESNRELDRLADLRVAELLRQVQSKADATEHVVVDQPEVPQPPVVVQPPARTATPPRSVQPQRIVDPLHSHWADYPREMKVVSNDLSRAYLAKHPGASQQVVDRHVRRLLENTADLQQTLEGVRSRKAEMAHADAEITRLAETYPTELTELREKLTEQARSSKQGQTTQSALDRSVSQRLRLMTRNGELQSDLESRRSRNEESTQRKSQEPEAIIDRPVFRKSAPRPRELTVAQQRLIERQARQARVNSYTKEREQSMSDDGLSF